MAKLKYKNPSTNEWTTLAVADPMLDVRGNALCEVTDADIDESVVRKADIASASDIVGTADLTGKVAGAEAVREVRVDLGYSKVRFVPVTVNYSDLTTGTTGTNFYEGKCDIPIDLSEFNSIDGYAITIGRTTQIAILSRARLTNENATAHIEMLRPTAFTTSFSAQFVFIVYGS